MWWQITNKNFLDNEDKTNGEMWYRCLEYILIIVIIANM